MRLLLQTIALELTASQRLVSSALCHTHPEEDEVQNMKRFENLNHQLHNFKQFLFSEDNDNIIWG